MIVRAISRACDPLPRWMKQPETSSLEFAESVGPNSVPQMAIMIDQG